MSARPYYEHLAAILHKAQGVFDAQDSFRQVDIGSEVMAVRRWCDESATAIREQAAEIERLTAIIDNAPLDELHGCDCCGATTTDAAEVDGHMQCRACTLDAQLATARAELEAAFRAGWIAGHVACGETNVDPDTDSAYQAETLVLRVWVDRLLGQTKQGEIGDDEHQ